MESAGTALVTDADRGSAVTIIRSLGRAGWDVIAADSRRRSIGFRSRYARQRLVYPSPESSPVAFADTIHRASLERGVDLVIPVTDEVILPLLRERERFEGRCRLALPETGSIERTLDKARTLALAGELGVPVPATRVVHTAREALEAAGSLGWPVVVKPARSRRLDPERGVVEKFAVGYAAGAADLEERMRPLEGRVAVLIQELCEGTGHGVELLALQGRCLAAFQHRRLAELPLTGGVSAWRESVALDADLFRHSARLVEALGWTGLLMVEFKVGEEARLMEINGRVWGSLPLALHSGMDFPARLAELIGGRGRRSAPAAGGGVCSDYRIGVRAMNLELMLKWIVRVLLDRRPPGFPRLPPRRRALAGIAALLSPRQRLDLSCADDPGPMLAELGKIARNAGAKLLGGLDRRRLQATGRTP